MTKCLLFLFYFIFFIYLFTLLLKTANRLTVMHIKVFYSWNIGLELLSEWVCQVKMKAVYSAMTLQSVISYSLLLW